MESTETRYYFYYCILVFPAWRHYFIAFAHVIVNDLLKLIT